MFTTETESTKFISNFLVGDHFRFENPPISIAKVSFKLAMIFCRHTLVMHLNRDFLLEKFLKMALKQLHTLRIIFSLGISHDSRPP